MTTHSRQFPEPKYDVIKAYDDRKKNVKMFREHDIPAKKV